MRHENESPKARKYFQPTCQSLSNLENTCLLQGYSSIPSTWNLWEKRGENHVPRDQQRLKHEEKNDVKSKNCWKGFVPVTFYKLKFQNTAKLNFLCTIFTQSILTLLFLSWSSIFQGCTYEVLRLSSGKPQTGATEAKRWLFFNQTARVQAPSDSKHQPCSSVLDK